MELAINTEFTEGKMVFKNAQLKTATQKIVQSMKTARKGFLTAGLELKRIQDEKLFEKDFFDADGKPSFAMYVELVLGISKTTAYRIMKTTEQLLAPEMLDENKPPFFENFSDGSLDALTTLGDYDTATNFCKAFDVCETTSRDTVREYVKAYRQGYKTLEEYVESTKEKEIDVEPDEENDESSDGEQITMEQPDQKDINEMRGYLEFCANLFKSDINYILELCEQKEEEKMVKQIVEKYSTDY